MVQDQRGMTLLELMVSMGLLALLAALVLSGACRGLLQLSGAGERSISLDYAISIMEELQSRPELLPQAAGAGLSRGDENRIFYLSEWQADLKVKPTQLSDWIMLSDDMSDAQLYSVELTVNQPDRPDQAVRLRSLIAEPGGGG